MQDRNKIVPTIVYPKISGTPRVKLRDLSVRSHRERSSLHSILDRFLDHGMWIMGDEVEQFEREAANFFGRRHAVGVASASAGLYLSLKALEIGEGHEVITTPMSWLVTSSAISLAGATPVFVDVDDNFNLDPECVEAAITSRTRAILPVHFYGRLADMNRIVEIASRNGLKIIEDVAQAVGAQANGVHAGAFGDIGIASFSPMKVISSLGDAGVIICNDEEIATRLRSLRHCGTVHGEICVELELKHTIDALHAAVARERLKRAPEIIAFRRRLAGVYQERLHNLMIVPSLGASLEHTVYDYTVRVPKRSEIIQLLADHGVESKVRHPVLICDQPVYASMARAELPRARRFLSEILCLPMHQNLSDDQVNYVCDVLESSSALRD